MPELTKTYSLRISVEQFLKACNENELQEVELLLEKYKGDFIKEYVFSSDDDFKGKINSLLSINELPCGDQVFEIPDHLRKLAIDLLKIGFSYEALLEALPIIENQIRSISPIAPEAILLLMRSFSRLESLRIKSLVKKPQFLDKKLFNDHE